MTHLIPTIRKKHTSLHIQVLRRNTTMAFDLDVFRAVFVSYLESFKQEGTSLRNSQGETLSLSNTDVSEILLCLRKIKQEIRNLLPAVFLPNSPNSTDGDEEDLCRDSNSTTSAVIDELSELEIDELLDGEITFAHYQRLVTYIENVLEALSTYIPDVRYRKTTFLYLMHCMHIPMKKKKENGV